jgi:hypothetical protein
MNLGRAMCEANVRTSRGLRLGLAWQNMKHFHFTSSNPASAQNISRDAAGCLIVEHFDCEFVAMENEKQKASRRASLIALGVVVVLFVLGWFLTRELYSNQKIEDCVLSGRTNCVPIDSQSSY